MYIYIYIYICICIYIYMCIYIYVYACAHTLDPEKRARAPQHRTAARTTIYTNYITTIKTGCINNYFT